VKVLHVTSGINPQSGGPTRSVKGLCRALSRAGVEVSLLVLRGNDPFENPSGVNVLRGDIPDISDYDLVHLHGLWNLGLHRVVKLCRRCKTPYVISPRGMLDPWALSVKKWKKKVAMCLYQRKDLQNAAAFHVTAETELEHVRTSGFSQMCIVSPNAVDLPEKMPEWHTDDNVKTVIFLSRLHPGKGLLTLARAWAIIRRHDWKMKIVGPDLYGHKQEVLETLVGLGISDEWEFVESLDDVQKWNAYRSASFMVHPSVSENFGITIAEGLAAELPVIATKGTPWKELDDRRCGWWIDIGVVPLAAAMQECMSMSDSERRQMGARGRRLIEEKYTWTAAVKTLLEGYRGVLK
jgi:glycosyltransferase involved in cell wall biosynthesis